MARRTFALRPFRRVAHTPDLLDRKQILLPWFIFVLALSAAAAPLRVGIDVSGEPLTFVDAKGVPTGFAVEIMNGIAREMHFEVIYTVKPWVDMMEDFKAGRLDALANITYTTQRTTFIEYTVPHLVMKGGVFVRKGNTTIKTAADLRDHRIAVKLASSPYTYLESHGWLGTVVPVASLRDALHAIADGRADATIDARVIGVKNIRDDRLNLEAPDIEVPEFAQPTHIGLHPGDSVRLALINEGLARLHTNGTYDRIYDKWIGPLEPRRMRLRDLQPYFLPAALLLAIIAGAFLWQRRLLRRLARRTAALRQSQEQLTLVLEGSEDGFWDWDMRTGHVERSERWASMLGYTLAEIPPFLDRGSELVHPDDRHLLKELHTQRAAGTQGGSNAEYRMRTKSGAWRWILNRGKVVARAPDGTPLRMAGTHTDITDLKQTREELLRQEVLFRFIYEHAPVGLSWLKRREEISRVVNPAHERITGVPAAKSRDTSNYVSASHPGDRARQRALEDRLYAGEIDHFSMEKRYVHPDGQVVWAMLTMHLHPDPITGDVQQVTTLVDIDELKRTEAERETLRLKMLETQKLESLGVLAGGIAHDFNNLLTVILGNATLARDDSEVEDDRLVQIEAAARRAADLCRQMLAYAGKGNFLIQHIDLSTLVRDTANLLNVSISKKVRVTLDLATRLPAIRADASQLRQVVMNLVINASDAQGDQTGEIRVSTSLTRPEPRTAAVVHSFDLPDGDCVCLEIADTGQGMSPATLARIFDPFFTTKFAGRGLGLAAVLGIVRAHQGALTVESAVGCGTTFRLFIPAAPTGTAPTTPVNSTVPFAHRPGASVLIADDEPSVLAAADTILRRHGYKTVLARDGVEAVRCFRENFRQLSAVLLDLTMPGLDGAEVLRVIRAVHPAARVLVMSGYSEQDVMTRLHGLGEVAVLRKPFTQDMLLARIAAVIGATGTGR